MKQEFEREEFVYRLTTFPIQLVSDVPYRGSPPDPYEVEVLIRAMADDIETERENSLAAAPAPDL